MSVEAFGISFNIEILANTNYDHHSSVLGFFDSGS